MRPKPLALSLSAERPNASAAAGAPAGHVARLAPERAAGEPSAARGAGSTPQPAQQQLAFEHVYETQFDFVWRSLLLLGVERHAVEDAAQDVFSVVSRRLGGFEGRSSLRTWLFAILQRVAANQRRTRRRKPEPLPLVDDGISSQQPTPLAQLEAAESINVVQRFCDTLEPKWQAVFVLALLEELPAPEVSQALGISVNTVYSRVRLLREGLRRQLEGDCSRTER